MPQSTRSHSTQCEYLSLFFILLVPFLAPFPSLAQLFNPVPIELRSPNEELVDPWGSPAFWNVGNRGS